jgi:hypothetical protein
MLKDVERIPKESNLRKKRYTKGQEKWLAMGKEDRWSRVWGNGRLVIEWKD